MRMRDWFDCAATLNGIREWYRARGCAELDAEVVNASTDVRRALEFPGYAGQ